MAGIVHWAWYTYCKGKFKSNDAQLRAGQYVSSLEHSSEGQHPSLGFMLYGWVGNYISGSLPTIEVTDPEAVVEMYRRQGAK